MTNPQSLDEIIKAVPHSQRTVWKDGIELEICWDDCPRCALEAYAAREAERRKGLEALRDEMDTLVKQAHDSLNAYKSIVAPFSFVSSLEQNWKAITALLDKGTAAGKSSHTPSGGQHRG